MKKFVLLPEAKHRQALAASAVNENRDVLQSIQQPEQREMLKRYHLAQNILRDAQHSTDGNSKMDEYREAMQDFSLLRDRRGGAQLPQHPVTKKRRIESDDNDGDNAAENDAAVVDVLPTSQKGNAQKLLRLLRAHGDEVVSWTRNGEVSIHGQRLRGTNIVDLIGDVVRSSPSKAIAPQRERFLSVLAEANVPETLVKNKTALERYREIKNVGAITTHRDEDDDEAINDATVSSTSTLNASLDNDNDDSNALVVKKKSKKQVDKTSMAIDWTAPL